MILSRDISVMNSAVLFSSLLTEHIIMIVCHWLRKVATPALIHVALAALKLARALVSESAGSSDRHEYP